MSDVQDIQPYADDRGFSFNDIFPHLDAAGQINYSTVYPGVIKAWHRHAKQWDHWFVLRGMARVALYDPETGEFETHFIGERSPRMISIPPGTWHGMTPVGPDPAGLLYHVTRKYDPADPDEERHPWDGFDYDWSVRFH